MNKKLYNFLLILLAIIFLLSGWKLFSYFHEGKKTQNRYDELAAIVAQDRATENSGSPTTTAEQERTTENPDDQPGPANPSTPTEPATEPEDDGMLPEFRRLYEANQDLVGWIEIEDTVINYPVVQTPEDPEYYLHRDFDGSDNARGCLFADWKCDVENSDNVIIYGHHMNDGSMFASLMEYTSKKYWQEYPEIRFDTLTERRTYEIFAVFRTTASIGQGFRYNQFTDAADQAEFDNFVAKCKSLSVYDTGIIPEYGEKLICLSTCEYTRENGRFVVMGVYRPE